MHSDEDKFKYFKGVLDEIYIIIRNNYKLKLEKIIDEIDVHIRKYNEKNNVYNFERVDDNNIDYIFSIYMTEYIKMRGRKRIFKDEVRLLQEVRKAKIDSILSK